ncbi:hypothetical protein [Sanguibacter suaedae]|uniref:Uncharacterized protein n=1 Tax=Sanguibacter suaedae TaxID=2795737 RepID=A0A934MCZ5_9MICO|nr:hypothetical protein [Sanguibacter suaedae]MBI9114329.1 hypothetical protein [Sanguibacter suaedae]
MSWFTRKDPLPADVRRSLDLRTDDPVVSQALLDDGSWAVATRHHLVLATTGDIRRRPWCDVDRGRWDPESDTVEVDWVDRSPTTALHVADPRRTTFVRVFRERVQWSVVLSETVRLPDGAARVAVRRAPEGDLFVQVVADPGTDPTSTTAAPLIRAAVSRLSSASGAPVQA